MKKAASFFLMVLIVGCTTPRSARQLKRETKEWRKADEVLWAYSDSPLGSTTLILRANNRFELIGSGMFMRSFEAGKWSKTDNTIRLLFVDLQDSIVDERSVEMDFNKGRVYLDATDTIAYMKILRNDLLQ
jgi:hypothetical protein